MTRTRLARRFHLLTPWLFPLCAACSSNAASLDGSDSPQGAGGTSSDGGSLDGGPGSGGGSIDVPGSGGLPAETEEVGTFRPPVVTGNYLWSSNPESGRIALIDAETLDTRLVSAGLTPTTIARVPSADGSPQALVLNTGNHTATFLQKVGDQVLTETVAIHVGANRWAVSPSGGWAAAYSQDEGALDPTQGLQDISLIDLRGDQPKLHPLTAGYRPREVLFDDAETHLVVIAEQGISSFELETGAQTFVASNGSDLDVSVTRDGSLALVHERGTPTLELVPLSGSGETLSVSFAGAITDVDLADTGRAVAVIRELSLFVSFDLPALLADPNDFRAQEVPGETIGSVDLTPDGTHAVLYTNAEDSDRLTIVSLETSPPSARTIKTETPIAAVRLTPDGAHAVALGKNVTGATTGSFAVVSVKDARFPRVVGTEAPVIDVALDDVAGVVTTTSPSGVHVAYVISLPSLGVEPIRLASPPLSAGVLPAQGLGFVSQAHAAGRVSFFDFQASRTRTLTGFELSAEVVDE